MSAALTVDRVAKAFGDVDAVADVSFMLQPDEILALVGPSGCGKSTLLRVIAGLYGADSGSLRIGDETVDDGHRHQPPERRRVGLVFQEHALFPHFNVADNVAFGLREFSRPDERVDETLRLVGLTGYRNRYPHELSGGERQRVALARALAPRPQLLLLDEPFASLDPNLRSRIRADVVAILRAEGIPAVFVTHDQAEALAVGDRIAVMEAGRFEQVGTPEAIFHQPSNQFVASFMGDASFLPVSGNGTGPIIEVGAHPVEGATDGAIAMLRPDDVTFEVIDTGSAVITDAEFRGSVWCYTLRLASGTIVRSTRSHLMRVPVGTRVDPSVTPGHQPVIVG